ncbi:patatin-like phospholipase family protein [Colwellia sp. MB02u-18]|uniref:patatin-like phospholipase family protein n=1 Tax=unclassified Colwellia TaxID=196834 RepID=UPI0015F38FBB|nr:MULTISPECIES: patatin-like phospholipase family protein [unclassified Colwellia]MBA6223034.1 patatin-like phospholipase family protein [Colwellia sp. MB3u-45]MBA6266203.1 patatin-like phospholipase family protein [Colwellia sp. MB3u-43]MBA6294846.1 patatin-like phospholipase family protein [Colwellia sp. MB02u-9]MBA6319679.1 patatin-like phospholipase family protein [Colwellia sp. MB02u-19]MBA6324287.1 patatin-like phospholipase family protein [Colwellia sp. MB02u-18]
MTNKRSYINSNNALVLTGGGARAAYQVGVLSAIAKFMPRNHGVPFPIICGTSAGAINSTALACYASCFQLAVKKLEWVWKNLDPERIYHTDPLRVFSHLIGGVLGNFQADYANKSARSLLNNAPLRQLLETVVDFSRIDTNIRRGYLSAVSVTASSYSSGDSISFFQSEASISPWFRAKRRGEPTQLNSQHLMASAAIPLVFPSERIQRHHLGDGSVHQLSPLSPAIHLGAEKIFIVGVEQPKEPLHAVENNPHPPTTAAIASHLLDSVFSDTLQSDIERMERVNNTLSLIPDAKKKNISGLKNIESYLLNPSHNFNNIAVKYYDKLPLSIRLLLRSMGVSNDAESSLVSYLLFEKNYCKELINLGFNDALEQETKIRQFLDI